MAAFDIERYADVPSIGLAMIVRDEEESAARAINSAAPVCRQVVVVDTGSKDRTPEICSSIGAEIYFKKWNDDFAEARNFALSCMRTDWIITLDADEVIPNCVEILEKYSGQLKDFNVGGLNVRLINYLDSQYGEGSASEHRYTRIFRNDRRIRFKGRVHEQIRDSIEDTGCEIVDTDIEIHHYGYAEPSQEKMQRNKELLERESAENPDDDWLKMHGGETEFSLGNLDSAEKIFTEIADSQHLSDLQKHKTWIRLGQIALSKENLDKVEQWLNFTSEDTDMEGLRKYVLAAGKAMRQKFDESIELYNSREVGESKLVDKKMLRQAVEGISKYVNK